MAETASVLSPSKTVLMPDRNAGCPMADMVAPHALREMQQQHPGCITVTYVNSSAAVKALSDVCCTSANAVRVVDSLPADRTVLFVPDQNLGAYVAGKLGRELVLWPGYCPTHHRILPETVEEARAQHPNAKLVVHPECRPAVVALAHAVDSTTGILRYCRETNAAEFLVGTEVGILHRLQKENPGKAFYPLAPTMTCPNMKRNNLERILWCLQDMAPEVAVPEDIAEKARRPIERMLGIPGG
jgi:quinolinate synthase